MKQLLAVSGGLAAALSLEASEEAASGIWDLRVIVYLHSRPVVTREKRIWWGS